MSSRSSSNSRIPGSQHQLAHKNWESIKATILSDSPQGLTENSRYLTHGIYQNARLTSNSEIKSVVHNIYSGQYLVLYEEGNIEVILSDGSKEVITPTELIGDILFASKATLYVALCFNENKIKVS